MCAMCAMTHSYVWHVAFWCLHASYIYAMKFLHMCSHDSFMRATWLIHMCDILCSNTYKPHPCMQCDSFLHVTWLIHMCDMLRSDAYRTGLHMRCDICDVTPSYVWHNSCIGVTWLIQTCDILRSSDADKAASYVQQDQWMRGTGLISMCTVTHLYMYRDSFIREAWILYMCVWLTYISTPKTNESLPKSEM